MIKVLPCSCKMPSISELGYLKTNPKFHSYKSKSDNSCIPIFIQPQHTCNTYFTEQELCRASVKIWVLAHHICTSVQSQHMDKNRHSCRLAFPSQWIPLFFSVFMGFPYSCSALMNGTSLTHFSYNNVKLTLGSLGFARMESISFPCISIKKTHTPASHFLSFLYSNQSWLLAITWTNPQFSWQQFQMWLPLHSFQRRVMGPKSPSDL